VCLNSQALIAPTTNWYDEHFFVRLPAPARLAVLSPMLRVHPHRIHPRAWTSKPFPPTSICRPKKSPSHVHPKSRDTRTDSIVISRTPRTLPQVLRISTIHGPKRIVVSQVLLLVQPSSMSTIQGFIGFQWPRFPFEAVHLSFPHLGLRHAEGSMTI